MSVPNPASDDSERIKVLSLNVWQVLSILLVYVYLLTYLYRRGLAIISKDRRTRIKAIAEYIGSSNYDIVCLQELWIYKDYEIVREEVLDNLPFSRFFHTSAQGRVSYMQRLIRQKRSTRFWVGHLHSPSPHLGASTTVLALRLTCAGL